mmetsp:Transcript_18082/g.37535  ORF Transcript_18082/g.37535 Transcript_18082/m.37535 type:complete len:192 (+) Transcript_18082:78-653(+)
MQRSGSQMQVQPQVYAFAGVPCLAQWDVNDPGGSRYVGQRGSGPWAARPFRQTKLDPASWARGWAGGAPFTVDSAEAAASAGARDFCTRLGGALPDNDPRLVFSRQLMGVDRNATPEQLRAAFRRMAKKCHPDVRTSHPGETRTEDFRQLVEAYQILLAQLSETEPTDQDAVSRETRLPTDYRARWTLDGA